MLAFIEFFFYQNQFINKYAKRQEAKISKSLSLKFPTKNTKIPNNITTNTKKADGFYSQKGFIYEIMAFPLKNCQK